MAGTVSRCYDAPLSLTLTSEGRNYHAIKKVNMIINVHNSVLLMVLFPSVCRSIFESLTTQGSDNRHVCRFIVSSIQRYLINPRVELIGGHNFVLNDYMGGGGGGGTNTKKKKKNAQKKTHASV